MVNWYSQDFIVKYTEMDHNLVLKPFSLLNYLQDLASQNAEDLGFGYSFICEKNLAWFLIKYRIEFTDYPVNPNKITVKTQPRGYNKLFAYRDFEIFNDDKLVGKAASMWSLVDVNSRSMIPIESAIPNHPVMRPFEKRDTDLQYGKIRIGDDFEIEKVFEVRYNDLDVNKHTNNGNYIIWAFEPLDYKFKETHKIKTMDIVFKKETKYGDKIISQLSFKDELTTLHRLKNENGDDICLFECVWKEI